MYLSLYCKGSKRVTQGLRVRGSWRPNRTAMYWPPLLWPSALCLSRSRGLLNRRPGGSAFCWVLAFSTTTCLQHSNWSLTVLTELYNSSTTTQSPTQSLESHVWSSSGGNNCPCSSEVTLFRCISLCVYNGNFYLVPFHQPSTPTRFPLITAIGMCHFPSGASPWNGKFGRVEGQNTTSEVLSNQMFYSLCHLSLLNNSEWILGSYKPNAFINPWDTSPPLSYQMRFLPELISKSFFLNNVRKKSKSSMKRSIQWSQERGREKELKETLNMKQRIGETQDPRGV